MRVTVLIAVFFLIFLLTVNAVSASNITINSDKTISIDGKKTFPVYIYSGIWCNPPSYPCEPSETPDYTFWAIASGYKYPFTQGNYNTAVPKFEATDVFWTGDLVANDGWLSSSGKKSSPNFFGYYQVDEPDIASKGITTSQLLSEYNQVKANDAAHPVILNIWGHNGLWYYKDYADILTWDHYPIVDSVVRTTAMYQWEIISRNFALKDHLVSDFNDPIFAVIQANGVAYSGINTPTIAEGRAMTYIAITMGVQGIGYWGYEASGYTGNVGLSQNPSLYSQYRQLAKELRGLNDILVMPTYANSWYGKWNDVAVKFNPNPTAIYDGINTRKLNYMLKQDVAANTWYLFVVNKDRAPVSNLQITIPALSESGSMTAKTLGLETTGSQKAGRTLTVIDGKFTDSFDGYAAHIYQICLGTCVSPNPNPTQTCSDGIKNQGEIGIDCGGPCSACTASPPTSLTLKPGWNQISSPLAAGIDISAVESAGCIILPYKNQKLWAWNATAQVWLNPTKVEPLKGYWIYAAYQCTIPLSGIQATFTSLPLTTGWNKISASGTFSVIQGTCAGHITGNWVWNWDKASEKWIHPTTMQLDKGYWIKVDQNCVLGA